MKTAELPTVKNLLVFIAGCILGGGISNLYYRAQNEPHTQNQKNVSQNPVRPVESGADKLGPPKLDPNGRKLESTDLGNPSSDELDSKNLFLSLIKKHPRLLASLNLTLISEGSPIFEEWEMLGVSRDQADKIPKIVENLNQKLRAFDEQNFEVLQKPGVTPGSHESFIYIPSINKKAGENLISEYTSDLAIIIGPELAPLIGPKILNSRIEQFGGLNGAARVLRVSLDSKSRENNENYAPYKFETWAITDEQIQGLISSNGEEDAVKYLNERASQHGNYYQKEIPKGYSSILETAK